MKSSNYGAGPDWENFDRKYRDENGQIVMDRIAAELIATGAKPITREEMNARIRVQMERNRKKKLDEEEQRHRQKEQGGSQPADEDSSTHPA